MVDIPTQVAYWRAGADEDWDVACHLVASGRVRHGLFFAHLALEKLLKALVCRRTQELAPRTHNLARLAEAAGLALTPDHLDLLAEMNPFSIEGRYPHTLLPPPTRDGANEYLRRAEEVRQWLTQQL